MKPANVSVVAVAACLAMIPELACGQPIPVPEYFGIYAVVGGHLLKLDGQEVHAEKTVSVMLGQRNGLGNLTLHQPTARPPRNVEVPEFPPNLKFVIFAEASGAQSPLDAAKSLHLDSLPFVRNLSVNTGWPSNIRRTDPENGWETGDAVELNIVASGDHPRELEILTKPMAGHRDMVIAGLAEALKPGVYRLSIGQKAFFMPSGGGMLFAVSPTSKGEAEHCVDALISYSPTVATAKYTPCEERAARNDADSSSPGEQSTTPSSSPPAEQSEMTLAWNKALAENQPITIEVCRDRGGFIIRPCERGALSLSSKEVSFMSTSGQKLFAVAPSEVGVRTTMNGPLVPLLLLEVGGKLSKFQIVPSSVDCPDRMQAFLACPAEGVTEQIKVAQYVTGTINKLATGATFP